MPASEVDRFTTLLANGFWQEAVELISEFADEGFEQVIENQEEDTR